ncbi:MAG: GTPase ObgE [Marinilabiliales bacterium]
MPETNFIDYVKIYCRSGNGGAGSAHLRKEKFVPKGGPDGGDGGRGGHIILKGNKQLWTLLHLKYRKHIKAGHGQNGSKQRSFGANGEDVVIEVPIGTVVKDAETNEVIFEITQDKEEKILLHGGKGGRGNFHFKSPTNQTPKYAQPGEKGSEGWFILELKLLADVGLVGFPNAGKSTLLSVISAAKPKIADYPFTTLVPNLGIVKYENYQSFVVADIPGIIEGAHEGKGLGLRFLRHIERNSILLFLIPANSENPKKEFEILNNELKLHNPELVHKDYIIAISKSDLIDEKKQQKIKKMFVDKDIIFISSITNFGIDKLKHKIWNTLNQ